MAFFPQKRTNFFERLFKRTNKQEQMNLDAENLPSSEQQEWIKHLCDNLQVGIWIKGSIDRKITFASKGLEDILEIPLKTFYKNPDIWKEMVLPMYRKELFKKYKLLKKGQSIEHYYRIRVSSGEVKWVYEQTIPQINEQGEVTHLFGMVSDVSAEMEMKKKLEYISKNDSLTSLPNQRSLDQKLDELVEDNHTSAFALLYIDLDNFSWVNDHLGFKIGDLVLLQTANRLMSMVPEDGFLARVNSNEFILIVRNYEHKDAVFQLAGEVIKRVSKQLNVEGYELHITTSIGISFFPENGDHKLIIMENAHTALFHAKNLGKNNYQFYSFDKDINSHKKYMLEQDLRKAIQNEEFELYYQPQVNPNSGAIEGSEALIRWNHHDWGIVSPGEFIPLAEEKHLIHEIGDWVIENVCSQLKIWKDKGYHLSPVSINISPIRFLRSGLVETVKKQLRTHQLPARLLELEITESTLLKHDKSVLSALKSLKDIGVKIALDDFGTGFASLHYLQNFDVDILKIDQTFIQNLQAEGKKSRAIVSSLLHLAKGLKMKVVAEGVEEYEQLEFLKQHECDVIQGYIYSKPVPVDAFERMMKTRYLEPDKRQRYIQTDHERREYFRFAFPGYLLAKMKITEVNQRKVNLGSANILVENISIGGIKFFSSLKLPINSDIKLTFSLEMMGEFFNIDGVLVWVNEGKSANHCYGVSFNMTEGERDKLAEVINKMTLLKNLGNEIPETNFIYENPKVYFRKNLLG